jgi:hypothetical protein
VVVGIERRGRTERTGGVGARDRGVVRRWPDIATVAALVEEADVEEADIGLDPAGCSATTMIPGRRVDGARRERHLRFGAA